MPAIIAIVGGSGSGKTWLAKKLKRRLGRRAGILSLDDFYRDLAHLPMARRNKVNFDHPNAIDWPLLAKCLKQIRRGEKTLLPRYDFATHSRRRQPQVWQPRPIVLIDGLWLLRRAELRRIYALTVFVDCPDALRLARRLARDQRERGRSRASVLRQWRTQVKPMHDRFVAPQKRLAKLVFGAEMADNLLIKLMKKLFPLANLNADHD